MTLIESDIYRILNQLEDALDRTGMVERNIPKARWISHRLASGYTIREIAIAEDNYRKGAEFVMRELRMQLETKMYVHSRPSPTDPPAYTRVRVGPDGPEEDRPVFKGRANLSVIPESSSRGEE